MESVVKIVLPKLGESIVSATVVRWFKRPGERVELDEPLLEVSTDKVNSEIPSPVAGFLQEILAQPDEELPVGAPLASISTSSCAAPVCSQTRGLSPAVARLLQERNIPLADLDKIPHSGEGGRLTKRDVDNYNAAAPESVERVKMSPMRKAIADNMVKSFYEAPHATLIAEVDVTALMQWIGDHKEAHLKEHGVKLTITPFVARAMARALATYPLINSSLESDTIAIKKFVHLGIAVSVDQGVMVPVIHNCQAMALVQIAKAIAELSSRVRTHSLKPEEVQGGTITLTNFGMTGMLMGVPIIRYPEVAIVGLGAITKKVAVLAEDVMAIRSVMMVSLTFDHRVLDGLYGCGFLAELKKRLEEDIGYEVPL